MSSENAPVLNRRGNTLICRGTDILKSVGSQKEVERIEVGGEGWLLAGHVVSSSTQCGKCRSNVNGWARDRSVAKIHSKEAQMIQLILGNFLCIAQYGSFDCCLLASGDWATSNTCAQT